MRAACQGIVFPRSATFHRHNLWTDVRSIKVPNSEVGPDEGGVCAAPTLIKKLPLPLRRIIGDMSKTERLLVGLDLRKKSEPDAASGTGE